MAFYFHMKVIGNAARDQGTMRIDRQYVVHKERLIDIYGQACFTEIASQLSLDTHG